MPEPPARSPAGTKQPLCFIVTFIKYLQRLTGSLGQTRQEPNASPTPRCPGPSRRPGPGRAARGGKGLGPHHVDTEPGWGHRTGRTAVHAHLWEVCVQPTAGKQGPHAAEDQGESSPRPPGPTRDTRTGPRPRV